MTRTWGNWLFRQISPPTPTPPPTVGAAYDRTITATVSECGRPLPLSPTVRAVYDRTFLIGAVIDRHHQLAATRQFPAAIALLRIAARHPQIIRENVETAA